jgi:hypothetical protein
MVLGMLVPINAPTTCTYLLIHTLEIYYYVTEIIAQDW